MIPSPPASIDLVPPCWGRGGGGWRGRGFILANSYFHLRYYPYTQVVTTCTAAEVHGLNVFCFSFLTAAAAAINESILTDKNRIALEASNQ